jgi:hypothetical protein
MALAFLSGCCALAYEILYMRALTTVLGDMLYVHAALLSTFLVGIGIGAKLAWHGWKELRVLRPAADRPVVLRGDPFRTGRSSSASTRCGEDDNPDADRFARRAGAFHVLNPWLFV